MSAGPIEPGWFRVRCREGVAVLWAEPFPCDAPNPWVIAGTTREAAVLEARGPQAGAAKLILANRPASSMMPLSQSRPEEQQIMAEDKNSQPPSDKLWYLRCESPEELRSLREATRSFHNDRSLKSGDAYVKASNEARSKAISYSVEYAKYFINVNLILNAGAILALLTFIGSLYGKGDIRTALMASYMASSLQYAFISFATGLILIVICTALSYINWIALAGSWQGEGPLMLWQAGLPPMEDNDVDASDKYIKPTMYAAIACGFLSTGAFTVGCFCVLDAFTVLDIWRHFR